MDMLVSTEWLAQELGTDYLRVLDASLFMPDSGRDARAEFEAAHIPGAVFFDLEEIVDSNSELPHMLPPVEKFASRMQSLGLGDGVRFVVYDNSPLRSAARAWWMLKVFGAHNVAILDGGLEKWKAEGRPLESGKPDYRHRHFTPWQDKTMVRGLDDMREAVKGKNAQILDARSPGRFKGTDPEPRPGVRSGHMPGATNVYYGNLYNEDGTFKSADELRKLFESAGVTFEQPVVTTCGSGITAANVLFALRLIGHGNVALYDGSWSEWGSRSDTPVITAGA